MARQAELTGALGGRDEHATAQAALICRTAVAPGEHERVVCGLTRTVKRRDLKSPLRDCGSQTTGTARAIRRQLGIPPHGRR